MGFYIGSEDHLTLGSFLPPFFYNWVFKKFKINKINSFVFASNKNIIKIHKYHGYKALEPGTILAYYVTRKYDPNDEHRASIGDFGEEWKTENK